MASCSPLGKIGKENTPEHLVICSKLSVPCNGTFRAQLHNFPCSVSAFPCSVVALFVVCVAALSRLCGGTFRPLHELFSVLCSATFHALYRHFSYSVTVCHALQQHFPCSVAELSTVRFLDQRQFSYLCAELRSTSTCRFLSFLINCTRLSQRKKTAQ